MWKKVKCVSCGKGEHISVSRGTMMTFGHLCKKCQKSQPIPTDTEALLKENEMLKARILHQKQTIESLHHDVDELRLKLKLSRRALSMFVNTGLNIDVGEIFK